MNVYNSSHLSIEEVSILQKYTAAYIHTKVKSDGWPEFFII